MPEMLRKRIPETRRLGRHVLHDPRSREFPAESASKIVSVDHASVGLPLDQGDLGSCTANALVAALNSDPRSSAAQPLNEGDAIDLYKLETKLEGSPYPPNDPGGTGLMVCRAGKHLGMLTSYRHAFGLEHALLALVKRPVIVGVNWYTGCDSPDPRTGIVKVSGKVRGGHEICATQIDLDRELVGFWNSWGLSYGLAGRFFMSFADLDRLLSEQGDVTVPHHA